jgi:hypothetical protein
MGLKKNLNLFERKSRCIRIGKKIFENNLVKLFYGVYLHHKR